MVKIVETLFNLFNKRKREIEHLGHVVTDLEVKRAMLESNLRITVAKNSLLEREKDALENKIRSYEDQVKKLNLMLSDLSRTSNSLREY